MRFTTDTGGFVLCPVCGRKTRQKAGKDTYLENFPLFCPKCKQTCLIGLRDGKITVQEAGLKQD